MTGMPFKSFPKFGQTELNPSWLRRFFRSIPALAEHRRGMETVLRASGTSDLTEISIRLNFFTTHNGHYGLG